METLINYITDILHSKEKPFFIHADMFDVKHLNELKQDGILFIENNSILPPNNIDFVKIGKYMLCRKNIPKQIEWLNNDGTFNFDYTTEPIYSKLMPPPMETVNHLKIISAVILETRQSNSTYIEYGVRSGTSIEHIADFVNKSHGIDCNNYEPKNSKINFYKMTTDEFSEKHLKDIQFDYAFIDADHSYQQVIIDFENIYKYLSNGGYIFLHDTYPCSEQLLNPQYCNDCYLTPITIKNKYPFIEILTLPFNPGLTIIRKNLKHNVFPISFAIPSNKIVDCVYEKKSFIAPCIPNKLDTFIYEYETDYYKNYQEALFGITFKKGGYDCMRHYEILACGCIPFFVDFEQCPVNTVFRLPRDLIKQGNELYQYLYNKYFNKPEKSISMSIDDMQLCIKLSEKLLDYTKKNLTTEAMASYLISKLEQPVKSILVLNKNADEDYLRTTILHGLKKILGTNCHDFPLIPHIYKKCKENEHIKSMYGKGFSYSHNLDIVLHDYKRDFTIENDIINKRYDYILYPEIHEEKPYFDIVNQNYPPNKIIMLCGADLWRHFINEKQEVITTTHQCHINNKFIEKGYMVFIREYLG